MNTAENIRTIELADQLEGTLEAFKSSFINYSPTIWLPDSWRSLDRSALEQTATHLTRIMYLKEQEPKETTRLPGLILVDETFADEIKRVNICKSELKSQVDRLKKIYSDAEFRKIKMQIFHRRQWSLKQAYRRFDLFEGEVDRVSMSWSMRDTFQKKANSTNLSAFINAHFHLESEKNEAQEIINAHPFDRLVFIRHLPPHLTGSFRFEETKSPKRLKVHSPVFLAGNGVFPKHPDDLSVEPVSKGRAIRSDKKELTALFPNLNLYYRP
ncbi:MAG: DNA replication terminus site-binding protein [Pseudomonadota bacterium]|nr:DNA replication terminus site-binding protein [Pseudomonadota bacterium]